MKIFKWQTEEKFLANMMLLSTAAFLIVSGYFFVVDGYRTPAPTYDIMTSIMPLEAWGVVMAVAGVFHAAAAFQVGRIRYWSMIVGGTIGAFVIMLYALASLEGAVSYLLAVRYALVSCFNLLIAALGGIEIWRIRKTMSRN